MQRKEPTTSLVNTLGDKVRRINLTVIERLLVLERIVDLSVRHSARVEPNIDQVGLAFHRQTAIGYEDHIIYIRTMQIDLVVIFFCIFTWLEAHFTIRIGFHESSLNSLVDLLIEFLNGSDTFLFLTILRTPDRQRSTPITAAAQVPVLQVLQPFTETARTGTLRFPVDRVVQLDHAITASGRTDKPAIQRIIEDWLISSPAMRIIVCMFLDLEYPVLRLQHHADLDIQSLILICLGWIIGVLYEFALEWIIVGSIHASLHEFRIQVFQLKELTRHIHHRTHIAIFILQHQRWNTSRFSYPVVISTESRRDVDNTCTILGRYIVSCDYPESALARINPRRQLLIMHIG